MEKFIPVCEPYLNGNELKYVTDAVSTGWISSSGQYVNEFEKKFAAYCDCKYGVAVCNGTIALHLALVSLGIGKGDEVIIPTVADKGSEDGIVLTLDHCKEILEQIDGVDFNYMILITMLQRTTTDRLYCERIRETYGNNHVYQSQIRFQAKPVKDAGFQSGILIDNQKANVARDYRELISEVMGEA